MCKTLINGQKPVESDLEIARKQVSDYAMALDLLARLSHSGSEKQAIENIIEIFTVLFSPGKVDYVPLSDGKNEQYPSEGANQKQRPLFVDTYSWTESGKGFLIKISHQANVLGIITADEIAFPQYKEQYLNLALSIIEVCGLVIENARKRELIRRSEQKLRQEKERAEQALIQVRQLSGLLPICMHCKKIRDDKGYWKKIEAYIEEHSEAEFSHGVCQECLDKYYPD